MGGRVALHLALAAPERVSALVLVSTTAGIEDRGRARARAGAPTSRWPRNSKGAFRAVHRALAHPAAVRGRTRRRSASSPRADQRRNRPDVARGRPARARHRGDGAAVGAPRRAGDASRPSWPATRDGSSCAIGAAHGSPLLPGAGAGVVAGRPRPAAGEPAAAAAGARRAERPRASGASPRPSPRPGPGSSIAPVAHRQRSSEARRTGRASPGRTAASARARRAPRRRAARRRPRAARRGRGQVDLGAGGAHERRRRHEAGDAAAAGDLQAHRIGHARRRARRARPPSRRSPRARRPARAPRGPRCSPWVGSSTSSSPGRRERVDRAHCLLHAPGAVRVQAQRDLRPGGRAHGRHAPGVVADADLQLQAAEPARTAAAACSAAPARSVAAIVALTGTAARRAIAEQRRDRLAARRPARSHSARSSAASACGQVVERRGRHRAAGRR